MRTLRLADCTKSFFQVPEAFNPRNPIQCILVSALCLFPAAIAYSQQKTLQFKHLTADDGLSSSIVVNVLQDYKGFMWFGTDDGLNRYDGEEVIVYKNSASDSTSIIENHIQAIFEDRKKNLYIGTWEGLSLYDRDHDRFVNYKFDKTSPFYTKGMNVNQIIEDSIGNLWLATGSGAIYFNRTSNSIIRYEHDPNDSNSISSSEMDRVHIDRHGRVWISTKKGLNRFRPETGTFQHITRCATHGDDISAVFFLGIVEDREGEIWFGSDAGLFCFENRGGEKEIALKHYQHDPKDPASLSINRSRALLIDDDGNLLIGTENGGINLYNKEKKSFYHYRIDDFNPMSLNNESIHAMTLDRNRNLWVCTWGGGVNVASYKSGFIINYKNLPGASQSLSFNIVSGFAEDSLGRIWVATDGGGFNLFDRSIGRFTRFNTGNCAIKSNALNCITMGTNGMIWMGTWDGGLTRYNCRDNTLKVLTTRNSSIPDNTYYSIAQDAEGNLWMGSFRHGLVYYQIKENRFTSFDPLSGNTEINVVRTDRHGRVFVGAANSHNTYIFLPAETRFIEYNIMPGATIEGSNGVYDILIENDTSTWVATKQGLYRFNPENKNNEWFFRDGGSSGTVIKGLAMDKNGVLWVTSNTGLYRFDYRTKATKHFTISDGLQSNEFYRSSILTLKNGAILAGGSNGFNVISPEQYSENCKAPDVVITNIHIFNDKVDIGTKNSPLIKQISETQKMTLSYKHSVLTFYFAAMDFSNPDKNLYAYRMENFDKSWTYCGNRKDATYTNLNPGTYRFHVKACNNDGLWNEDGASVELVITPPWWKTKIARVGFVVLLLLLLLWIYLYFRSKQEQQHLRELVASQKKTEDIMRSIDEAIFTINKDMSINSEHSKTAEKIFGITEFKNQNLTSLFHIDEKSVLLFAKWLKLAFQQPCTSAGWEKATRCNPLQEVVLERESRTYLSINYQPIYENGILSRVMVIANDITLRKKAELHLLRLNTEKKLLQERVFAIVNHDFDSVTTALDLGTSIISAFEALNLNAIEECLPRLQELGRDLHTVKGSGGSMKFTNLSSCCDELESALEAYTSEKSHLNSKARERVDINFKNLKAEIEAITKLRTELYRGKEDKLSIEKSDFAHFNEELKKGVFQSIDEISHNFLMLNSLKFSEFCREFSSMVIDYSDRLQKNIGPLKVETPDIRVERSICNVLKGPVTHLVRNALDHGIEDNATREKSGKGPGLISMAVHERNGNIEVEIADDGKGIDPERVAASAIKKGFITPERVQGLTDGEKQNLIFLHGFTTRDEATAISGRGVGMDAVKTAIERAGGGVKYLSRIGEGTRVFLWVPRMPG
jgi:ligand-binding sensor domain-containing protein/PAS domain-containing protein/HPt (histidine-containing phosphotransfer) domain-containing protein